MEKNSYLGIDLSEIKKHCIICPVGDGDLFKELGESKKSNGLFAKTMTFQDVTIISTKNNFLVGDVVLQLKNTECENIILFGSCGGLGLNCGDKVIVKKNVSLESFSEMLEMKRNPDVYYPSPVLVDDFISFNSDVIPANSATVNSIFLENLYKDWFIKNRISAVDMETSLIFSASSYINKKAMALLYVTDIISQQQPFDQQDEKSKQAILSARQSLSKSICNFIKNG